MASASGSALEGTNIPMEQRKYDIPAEVLAKLGPTETDLLITWLEDRIQIATSRDRADIESLNQYITNMENTPEKKDHKQKDQSLLEASYARVVAEKAELNHENEILHQNARQHLEFLSENQVKRQATIASHQKELDTLRGFVRERGSTIRDQQKKVNELLDKVWRLTDRIKMQKLKLSDMQRDLEHYRRFDAIIDQVQMMSAGPPGSSKASFPPDKDSMAPK